MGCSAAPHNGHCVSMFVVIVQVAYVNDTVVLGFRLAVMPPPFVADALTPSHTRGHRRSGTQT